MTRNLAFACSLFLLPLAAQAEDSAPRVLTAEVAATGLDTLALQIGVGEVHVTASSDDKVHARVTLRRKEREFMWFFHWMAGGTRDEIAAAAIQQQTSTGRLTLSLSYPHSGGGDDMKQEWDVQLPARLKLEADMQVGDLDIEGVEGGVSAKLNVGQLNLDLPKGAIDADVNVGEIRAKSGSLHHGHIELASNIGDTMLILQGTESGVHQHGGLGSHVYLDGAGADNMQLKLNIGEVTLHINPQDDAKPAANPGDGR